MVALALRGLAQNRLVSQLSMGLLNQFRRQTTWARYVMVLALVCLLGAQILGFAHRVAHGDRLAQIAQSAGQETLWVHDDHNCQLFDALTLASFAGTAAALPVASATPPTFLALPGVAQNLSREALGFHSRAPPELSRLV